MSKFRFHKHSIYTVQFLRYNAVIFILILNYQLDIKHNIPRPVSCIILSDSMPFKPII